jgi:hypothetical protein
MRCFSVGAEEVWHVIGFSEMFWGLAYVCVWRRGVCGDILDFSMGFEVDAV